MNLTFGTEGCQFLSEQRVCRRHIRGFLEPALLLLLHLGDSYGYDLCASLGSFGLGNIDPSLVYRMLRELETANLVDSQWQTEPTLGPARRVYRITEVGEIHLDAWLKDLRQTDQALHYFFQVYDCRKLAGQQPSDSAQGRAVDIADISESKITNEAGGKDEMNRIAVSSEGHDLDAAVNPVFGRCAVYVFVDLDTLEFEAVDNPAAGGGGGAGIQAAQFIIERGARAALTGNVGPNAFEVFKAANLPVYMVEPGLTVRQAVERFKQGKLQTAASANVRAHAGMARGQKGKTVALTAEKDAERNAEIEQLKQTAAELRRQLAEVMTRIEKLEES